ncbi:MAG: GlpM family protein [Methanoregula sp.]|nr:GlpM family protein [Methanoregula sp.]
MDILYTLIKFIAGGCIIVGVTLLAQHIDPKYGAIIATAPIITTVALLFTYSESGFATTRELALGSFYFVIPTVLFLVSLYLMMGRFSFLMSLCGAYGIWIVALLAVNRLIGSL